MPNQQDIIIPEDIKNQIRYFGKRSFDIDSPILALKADWYDYKTRKHPDIEPFDWDSVNEKHLLSIKSLLSEAMEFIKHFDKEEEWLQETSKIIMTQSIVNSAISSYTLETLIYHQVLKYLKENPETLVVLNVMEKFEGRTNWYKRAQEEKEIDEDIASSISETMAEEKANECIEAVESVSSTYGAPLDQSDKKWIANDPYDFPSAYQNHKDIAIHLAMSIIISRWFNGDKVITFSNIIGDTKKFDICYKLMQKWIVNNRASFTKFSDIYDVAIKTLHNEYSSASVVELIFSEMQFSA